MSDSDIPEIPKSSKREDSPFTFAEIVGSGDFKRQSAEFSMAVWALVDAGYDPDALASAPALLTQTRQYILNSIPKA